MHRPATLLLFVDVVAGHGHLNHPPSRQKGSLEEAGSCLNDQCLWFSQPVHIPGAPTLNEAKYRTYNIDVSDGDDDWTRENPWRAPGSAPVYGSGCGAAGGGPQEKHNGGVPPLGFEQGADSLTIPPLERSRWAIWTRGAVEEAIFAINANHGGGYSYRLCRQDGEISELCQQTVLRFAGDTQWIQWGADATNRTEIPLVTVSEGTTPSGSQWARNPIPACLQRDGGYMFGARHSCPDNLTQFQSPSPGIMGFGGCDSAFGRRRSTSYRENCSQMPEIRNRILPIGFDYNIVDKLRVPDDIEPGDYLLSWRWDCEQTDQVWQTCSDITIVDPSVEV